jgi:hypothetical protein
VVGTFTGTILMKGVRCSGFNSIAHLFEQVNNFCTMTKFATEIKAHVFVRNIHGKAMLGKPMVEEIDGRGFAQQLPDALTTQKSQLKKVRKHSPYSVPLK